MSNLRSNNKKRFKLCNLHPMKMKSIILSVFALLVIQLSAQTGLNVPSEKVDLYKKDAITFYFGAGHMPILDTLGNAVKKNLMSNFPEAKLNISRPIFIGYQFHPRENISIGMVYCNSNVKTDDLTMPDFQNPTLNTKFYYNIALTSLMGSFDWYWMKFKRPKSTFALHSGIALGIFNFSATTEKISGTGNGVDNLNLNITTKAIQLTFIGVKHTMASLKGFGWFANLGIGHNSMGISYGINYTL